MTKLGAVLLILLLVVVYLAGYWPQHGQLQETDSRLQSTNTQLANAQARLRIYALGDRLAQLIETIEKKNYGDAQKLSSECFDQVRAEIMRSEDEKRKTVLQAILDKRDAVTTGLAKGEPGTVEAVRQFSRELRQLVESPAAANSVAPPAKTN